MTAPDFKPCERTVRLCIEAINYAGGGSPNHHRYQNALLAVKAKADPAKALVEEWALQADHPPLYDRDAECVKFARWLFSTGRIRSGE